MAREKRFPKRLPLGCFIAEHPEHGECICDEFAFRRRQDADERWQVKGKGGEQPLLADLVDDRALAGLKEIGIETVEEFKRADHDKLIQVKYITEKAIGKVLDA